MVVVHEQKKPGASFSMVLGFLSSTAVVLLFNILDGGSNRSWYPDWYLYWICQIYLISLNWRGIVTDIQSSSEGDELWSFVRDVLPHKRTHVEKNRMLQGADDIFSRGKKMTPKRESEKPTCNVESEEENKLPSKASSEENVFYLRNKGVPLTLHFFATMYLTLSVVFNLMPIWYEKLLIGYEIVFYLSYRQELLFMQVVRAYEKLTLEEDSAKDHVDFWQDQADLEELQSRSDSVFHIMIIMATFLIWRSVLLCLHKSGQSSGCVEEIKPSTKKASIATSASVSSTQQEKILSIQEKWVPLSVEQSPQIFVCDSKLMSLCKGACKVLHDLAQHDGMLTRAIILISALIWLYQIWMWYKMNAFASSNPFYTLGIEPTTEMRVIKKAFRRLSLRYHPD